MIEVYVRFVKDLATRSTCVRAKVACLILSHDGARIYALGYNGRARGEDHGACTGEEGRCGCVHDLANALVKCPETLGRGLMLSTTAPCAACARLIINSKKIEAVYFLKRYRQSDGLELLTRAGVVWAEIESDGEIRSCDPELRAFERVVIR